MASDAAAAWARERAGELLEELGPRIGAINDSALGIPLVEEALEKAYDAGASRGGGGAYPLRGDLAEFDQRGMTLRQAYAKAAMEGGVSGRKEDLSAKAVAADAFLQADAMLAFERGEGE